MRERKRRGEEKRDEGTALDRRQAVCLRTDVDHFRRARVATRARSGMAVLDKKVLFHFCARDTGQRGQEGYTKSRVSCNESKRADSGNQ